MNRAERRAAARRHSKSREGRRILAEALKIAPGVLDEPTEVGETEVAPGVFRHHSGLLVARKQIKRPS